MSNIWGSYQLTTLASSPSKSNGRKYVFLAENVEKTGPANPDENENIEIVIEEWTSALTMTRSGVIKDSAYVAATWLAIDKLGLRS